ncbi:ABC transporter permease subunit [Roseobacter sp. HKCCD9010]|uniref:ABC transporter permease n=1 Tax=unclassified Roseobacter TaxID=196798 RepID=UPI0014913667|nr:MULTISPECIES: ABC transporter permease [unclassified Roseobacter]MBF9050557.1 ABC transporter permease subunit [Rhodobacterales bacterium HKCCD4356]NNV12024.1 ABC transporter permease subunit [Roseobacter sp. HKCCD7357]NNV17038.1 ABC transporter permease subunit [Roseobacter sp. HKCCD8768]NNV26267.1 ABC transporter permease subunit [Roseobacter sp. HKCCD8192]NNV30762.1 ABC transporter permease subunit [Roseobacter sp. HKCCD9061]
MDPITWTGSLGPYLNPLILAAVVVFILGFLAQLVLNFAGVKPGEVQINADHTFTMTRSANDYALMAMKYAVMLFLACVVIMIIGGIVQSDLAAKGIIGGMGQQFLPVWIALIVIFALSINFKRKLGLYGKLFDSPIGMVGFFLVMFWMLTAIFANMIGTHGPIDVISQMRNEVPGTFLPNPDEGDYLVYLLGGDNLGRDVFSRMVFGAREVLKIAPAATLFAFMVGITLGLPAGYFGGKFDTALTFIANLVLAFPVILLFYLLVTPEIVASGIPTYMAAVLFLFPIIFFVILFNSRYFTQPMTRNFYIIATLIIGGWLYLGLAWDADPLGLISMPGNILIVFVSVVFVNSPTVFRIVRGIVLDIKTRDYVAAGQTRGEGPWYIMLWEILPNARGPLIVDFCLRIGYTTILLGTLGFFGLGVSPESPDWGSTINEGRRLLTIYPHPALPPALALMTMVLGLNLLADGLREESLKD